MATTKPSAKKVILTRKRAALAAKKAKQHYARAGKKTRTWEKGGKQWSRVLGHFGMSA
jgi:hypothetical protein